VTMMMQMTRRIGPDVAMRRSAIFWFAAITAGHWIFLSYIIAMFGTKAIQGDFAAWNDHLSKGYVSGDHLGNGMVAAHLLFGAFILGAGPLQLIPQIRSRFPSFHRWTGRIYMASVYVAVTAGLYMLFSREIGSWSLKAGFLIQAVLILVYMIFALRHAMARQFTQHRRWALRFFMVSSIALSYRVVFVIWMLLTGGIGIDLETGKGVFLDFMAIGQFAPLLCLELYFRIEKTGGIRSRYAIAVFLGVAGIATCVGVLMLTIGFWFPLG